ncbi:MAG: macro domain-containing protein [Pseudomonadota bacterium]
MLRWVLKHWREFFRSLLWALGAIFLPLEAYEVLKNGDITLSLPGFLAVALIPGTVLFFLDGYLFSGFLRREVTIPNPTNDTKIRLKFGNIFEEQGWKAIGANDFFDSIVDEDLVSSKSLHGHVLSTYWQGDREDWRNQVNASLRNVQGTKESRPKGNRLRYPIGTTARACTADQKFLFVALGKTDAANNVTSANAEILIKAVRGMAAEARAACSMEPLSVPLMGSGLSRVGIKNSALVDLIITAILEEGRDGQITGEVNIVLPEAKAHEINLKNHVRNWTNGQ